MKNLFIISILLFLSFGLNAQNKYLKDVQETQDLSKNIVSQFNTNKISESFDQLKIYWPIPHNEIESMEDKTIKFLNVIEGRFGKQIGSIKVKNETISDFSIRETYLIRYENTAMRLIFTYYKNDKGWIVNAFKWDDLFTEEFK